MAPKNLTSGFSCFFTILAIAAVFHFLSAAASKEGDGQFCYEECLRRAFAKSPPPPPSGHDGFVISRSIVCKDTGRAYRDSVQMTGKLPRRYLQALCHVLKDEAKVEAYVKDTFWGKDTKRLFAGRSCKTVTGGKRDPCSNA